VFRISKKDAAKEGAQLLGMHRKVSQKFPETIFLRQRKTEATP
jgi:hypothetical protein